MVRAIDEEEKEGRAAGFRLLSLRAVLRHVAVFLAVVALRSLGAVAAQMGGLAARVAGAAALA